MGTCPAMHINRHFANHAEFWRINTQEVCQNYSWSMELNLTISWGYLALVNLYLLTVSGQSQTFQMDFIHTTMQSCAHLHESSSWSKGSSWSPVKSRTWQTQDFELQVLIFSFEIQIKPRHVPNSAYLNRIKCDYNHKHSSAQNQWWNSTVC